MSPGVERALAVAVTDVRARLRRPASAWLLAALALAAYFTVPPPSAGRGLFVIDGARVRYTSEALACATGALLSLLLPLFGFYVVSRAVGHDARTGVGPLVAATPVRRAEYLLGKLLGSTIILGAVSAGFLACILGMHLVRGEGPLLPHVYAVYYLVLGLPCILGVAAFALLFESVPGLGGRAGDFFYFFVWLFAMPLAMEVWKGMPTGEPGWGRFLDSSGLGFAIAQVARATGSTTFTIGATPFDVTKAPVEFPGLSLTPATIAWRAESLLLPVLLVLAAMPLFHRFDPARSRPGAAHARWSPLALARALARPLSRVPLAVVDRTGFASRGSPVLRTLAAEVLLTARLNPLLVLTVAVSAVLAAVLPLPLLRAFALPTLMALLVPLLADTPVRETQAGVAGIVYAAPGLRRRLVPFKLATASCVALLVTVGPAVRLLVEQPGAGVSLVLGRLLLASASVLLGIATGSPKPFMALALGFWYVALSAGEHVPALDFAGWAAAATPAVRVAYAIAVALAAGTAVAMGRLQERLRD